MGMMGMGTGNFLSGGTGMMLGELGRGFGVGMQIGGQRAQALSEQAAAKWNAAIAERNAELAEIKADNAEKIGELEAKETRLATGQLRGEQRSGYAAGGVDVNYGSAAAVQANTVAWGEYEAQKSIYNASVTAWEYRTEAANKRLEATATLSSVSKPNMAAYIIGGVNPFLSGR